MPETAKTALELLEQLRQERNEIDALIQGLEKRLGIISQSSGDTGINSQPRITVSIDSIPLGFFHNLSQAASAEKLLKMNPGHPLTTNEIMEAFRKSGMEMGGKNAVTILYTTLKRSPKFERVAGKAWGLADWYQKRGRSESDEREQE